MRLLEIINSQINSLAYKYAYLEAFMSGPAERLWARAPSLL